MLNFSGVSIKIRKASDYFKENKILLSLIIVGAFLRVFDLNSKSLWYDEACSISFTEYGWKDIFTHRYIAKPVYFIILKIWVNLFGNREFSARFLSVIFGVLSVLLIYKVAKELFGKKTGLVSAFLLSVSPYQIYYSQEVRNYSLFCLLGLISFFIFAKLLNTRKIALFLLFILINVLAIYTLPFGVFTLIVFNIFFLIRQKEFKAKKLWILSQVAIIISLLPLLLLFINNPRMPGGNEIDHISKPGLGSLIKTLEVFSYGGPTQAQGGTGYETASSRLVVPRILTFLLSFFSALWLLSKDNDQNKLTLLTAKNRKLLLSLWLLFPVFTSYLFSIFIMPIYLDRFFLLNSAAFYIIIANYLLRIRNVRIKNITIAIIAMLLLFSLHILYHPGSENDWRKIAFYVRSGIKKGDVILLAPINQVVPFMYYYQYENTRSLQDIDRYGKIIDGKRRNSFFVDSNLILGIHLKSGINSISSKITELKGIKEDIWLVISPYWIGPETSGLLKKRLRGFCSIKGEKYFEYNGVEVIHLIRR